MWFGVDGKGIPRRKTYLSEREGILKKAPKHDKKESQHHAIKVVLGF